jgi:hypothetical protein
MFNKLERIHKAPNSEILQKLKPIFEFKQKVKDGGLTREQKLEIKAVNKYYKNKLNRQSSFYSLGQWNKEFEKSLSFKKNICEFPCIDFHKTKRGLGEEAFNRIKKEYSNSIINNGGNYFQRAKFKNINLFSPINKNNEENGKI